ncbi:hypothetical protein QE152_g31001 [Popillia japonica]|uniref:Uncharacterized protein n=1 Tax=Popillia japonica TaxID=7064 RepID=A0AAW1JCF9_POPJA
MAVRKVKSLLRIVLIVTIIVVYLTSLANGTPADSSPSRYHDIDVVDVQDVEGQVNASHRYLFKVNYNCPPGSRIDFRGRCRVKL